MEEAIKNAMEETAIAHFAYHLASLNEEEASKKYQRAMNGASDELKKSALDEMLFFQEMKRQKRNEYIAANTKENKLRRIALELDDKIEDIRFKCAIVVVFLIFAVIISVQVYFTYYAPKPTNTMMHQPEHTEQYADSLVCPN